MEWGKGEVLAHFSNRLNQQEVIAVKHFGTFSEQDLLTTTSI